VRGIKATGPPRRFEGSLVEPGNELRVADSPAGHASYFHKQEPNERDILAGSSAAVMVANRAAD